MAIAAQRFSMLDQETNVGTGSFKIPEDSVFNTKVNQDVIPNPSVDNLISSGVANNIKEEESLSPLDKATRWVKGAAPSFTDISKLPASARSEFLGTITGNNAAAGKSLDNMMNKCSSSNGFGRGINGRPPDASINCGNGNMSLGQGGMSGNGCSAYNYSDLLGKLTNGGFSSLFSDAGSAMRAIMALAGYGYNLGMCGIFGAVVGPGGPGNSLTNAQQSMVSGSLLSSMGLGRNTNGFLDVAKSSAGLSPLSYNPDAIGTFYDNYSSGNGYRESHMCTMSDRSWAGGELLDDGWNKSSDGSPNLGELTRYSSDLGDITKASLTNRSYGPGSLNTAPSMDSDFFKGAYSMGEPTSANDLMSSLNSLW